MWGRTLVHHYYIYSCDFLENWRRDRDSNPGVTLLRPSGFQPAPFGLSGILPEYGASLRVTTIAHSGATRQTMMHISPTQWGRPGSTGL